MKKKDIVLILAVLMLAGVVWIILQFVPGRGGSLLKITVDGRVYGTYPLDEDRTIEIGGTNTCVIEGGVVSMTEANCPDLICVHTEARPSGAYDGNGHDFGVCGIADPFFPGCAGD